MRVRITSIPPGEAPLWVREKWIGIVLEGEQYLSSPCIIAGDMGPVGVLTHDYVAGDRDFREAFMTSSAYAIETLRLQEEDAAKWWDENFDKILIPTFIFPRECFVVIEQ